MNRSARSWRVSAVALVLMVACLTAGCEEQSPCLPEPMTASPDPASVGSTIVVSAPPATCDLGYQPGTQYTLALFPEGDGDSPDRVETTVEVGTDGTFSTQLRIPEEFPLGRATISVSGSAFDRCPEDPPEGVSCAGYSVDLTVVE